MYSGGSLGVTTVRFEDEEIDELKKLAKESGSDQSSLLRQALRKGIREVRIESALEKYRHHKITMSQAAGNAHLTLWEFMDELRKRNEYLETDEKNLEENLKEFE